MATATNPMNFEEFDDQEDQSEVYAPEDGHRLPGWTVDALLADGKEEAARQELERLIQEGLDSGPGIQMTEQLCQDIVAKARVRVRQTVR